MNDVRKYVERLFKGHKETDQLREWKEEIISNLEAKVADLCADGMAYREALEKAVKNIENIDFLLDGNKTVYINRFWMEFFQIVTIYLLIAWIVTIPFQIVGTGIFLNIVLFIAAVLAGIIFLAMYARKQPSFRDKTAVIREAAVQRLKKWVWLVWGLFITVLLFSVTAVQFGSNFWFGYPVTIDGPYQFALLVSQYVLPLISMVIPLLVHVGEKLLQKHEVGDLV